MRAAVSCYPVAEGGAGPARRARAASARRSSAAIADGARIIVLSDRESDEQLAPIPSLLLTVGRAPPPGPREAPAPRSVCVVEAGDAREVHHMALLVGFGAAAINPYMAFESIEDMVDRGVHRPASTRDKADRQLRQGRRQGRAQGDVQDGHLDARVLHRRAAVPGDRPRPGAARRVLHRTAVPARRYRPRRHRRRRRGPARDWPTSTGPTSGRTASSRSAASTSGAARASTTCSTRTRCSSCSTPPAPVSTRSSRSTPKLVDDQSERLASLRGLLEFNDGDRVRRFRSTRSSRPPRSSSGSPPAR